MGVDGLLNDAEQATLLRKFLTLILDTKTCDISFLVTSSQGLYVQGHSAKLLPLKSLSVTDCVDLLYSRWPRLICPEDFGHPPNAALDTAEVQHHLQLVVSHLKCSPHNIERLVSLLPHPSLRYLIWIWRYMTGSLPIPAEVQGEARQTLELLRQEIDSR
eukprot:TRINITY_DN9405_c0_g1_i3.p1 TRINITY_DN9405_c0_g1~~TRINITY_DN9405_c0_g1_i3.p1  ORF type:complete len:169 (+),score=33.03 TRINITY_DN9405_c0_g1_i3:28-507(+)